MTQTIAVDRTVRVRARPETVFRFLSESESFAAWMGEGSTIDVRPGGPVRVRFPGGTAEAHGEVVEVDPPRRIVFTWGYPDEDRGLPPGSSTVEIVLEPQDDATLVHLVHRLPSDELAQAHVAGWRHHLSHLASLSSRRQHAGAVDAVEAWHRAWAREVQDRRSLVDEAVVPDVEVDDELVTLVGAGELAAHIDNAVRHLPGIVLVRAGAPLVTAGRVCWPWALARETGEVVGRGTNVATLDLDGRIARLVGFWEDDADTVSRRVHGLEAPPAPSPPGGPDVEPHVWVDDVRDAAAWYRDVLGFEVDARHPADGTPTWMSLRRGRAAVMLATPPAPGTAEGPMAFTERVHGRRDHGGPLSLYLHVEDADAVLVRAEAAGADVIEPIWDPWWGGREFTVEAPDRTWWTVRASAD